MHPDLKWLAENVSEWPPKKWASVHRDSPGDEPWVYWSDFVEDDHRVTQHAINEWQAARQQLEDERMDVVARNGNDGLHYPDYWDGVGAHPASGQTCLFATSMSPWYKVVIKYISRHGVVIDIGHGVEAFVSSAAKPEYKPVPAERQEMTPEEESEHGPGIPHPQDVISTPNCRSVLVSVDDPGKQPRYQDATGDDWIDEFARTATPEEFRGAMRFTIGKYNRRMGKKDELTKEIAKMRDYCDRWLAYERDRGRHEGN